MTDKSDIVEELRKSSNYDELNDIVLSIAQSPSLESIELILSIFRKIDFEKISKFLLNFIYVIGEVGLKQEVPDEIMDILHKLYMKSDRWIRREIIQSLGKISRKRDLNQKSIDLINLSLNDEYNDLKIVALDVLIENAKYVSLDYFNRFISLLDYREAGIGEKSLSALKKILKDEKFLVEKIKEKQTPLNKFQIRKLITLYSDSVRKLSDLRNAIESVEISREIRDLFLAEINTMMKIILRN